MTAEPKPKIPRIVELLRVSGQGQADRDTPADQRAALDKLRKSFPGDLVERIDCGAVKAVSGAADLNQRPDLQRLAELSRSRAYDELRVRHLDRLTRHTDPRERFAIFGMVQDAGAVIRDASGHVIDPATEIGEVDYFLQTWMSAKERKRIRERTLAARHRLTEQGVPCTTIPYGRRYDRKTNTWRLDEREAAVYRRFFADVIDRKSLPQIAAELNEEGIPSPRGGAWHAGPIRNMIHAANAVGRMTSYGHPIECPAIVDEATQKAACAALRSGATWSGPKIATREALLRKIARCTCGARMHVTTGGTQGLVYYACPTRRDPGGAEGACKHYHNVERVDAAVKDALRAKLDDPAALARSIARPSKDDGSASTLVDELRTTLADLATREEKLVRLNTRGMVSEAVFDRQAKEIAKLRQGAEERLSVTLAQVEAQQRRAVRVQDVEQAVARAAKLLRGGTFAGWRKVVELVFGGPGASVVIHEDGSVQLDGGLTPEPVTQPEGDTGWRGRSTRERGSRSAPRTRPGCRAALHSPLVMGAGTSCARSSAA